MIGDSPMYVDTDGNMTIKNTQFKGTEGLWELLRRKNVNMEHVSKTDFGTCKKILLKTNAHLKGSQQGETLNITRGKKLRPCLRTQRVARRCGIGGRGIEMDILYYDPAR
jgi:hypothetical protein